MAHCLGSGSTAVQTFRGATFHSAVLNPRALPSHSFSFVSYRAGGEPRGIGVDIEQRWRTADGAAGGSRADDTGACVWDAAVALCDRLCELPEVVEGRAVVELGSGCGLLAIVAGMLGAGCVNATDLPQALLLLARNVWLNTAAPGQKRAGSEGEGGGVHVGCCSWGDESHANRVRSQCPGGRVDVIIGSDLIYRQSRATFEALLTTIAALCSRGSEMADMIEQDQHRTRVLFCIKHRMNPEDALFTILAKERGFDVKVEDLAVREGVRGTFQLISLQLRRPVRDGRVNQAAVGIATQHLQEGEDDARQVRALRQTRQMQMEEMQRQHMEMMRSVRVPLGLLRVDTAPPPSTPELD